jgi:thymidylate synthase
MTNTYFVGVTLDDVMREVIQAILSHGARVQPSKGWTTELTGTVFEMSEPLARLSRTETRGKPFSALGEFCWYLAGTRELAFIEYYISGYKKYADGNVIHGGYGPRLFNWRRGFLFRRWRKGINQVANVIDTLKKKPSSRQAVIQLFDANDIVVEHNDVPCTCTLQFMIRNDRLNMYTHMRSNDAFVGLPHDVFCFTMLQEIVARSLGVELGFYKHSVGSLHIYDANKTEALQLLAEGWQSRVPMPPMPRGDPWHALQIFRKAEHDIRHNRPPTTDGLAPYWRDLVCLLQIFAGFKIKDVGRVRILKAQMSSRVFDLFIDEKLAKMERRDA